MRTALWIIAVLAMLGAAVFQRRTGPTYPLRGTIEASGGDWEYRLVRSGTTGTNTRVEFPAFAEDVQGVLLFKRYPTTDEYTATPLVRQGDVLTGVLPHQPPAGKLEYYLEIDTQEGAVRVPSLETVIIRFKDGVPVGLLLPHILLMFVAMLLGVRAGLSAIFDTRDMRSLAWTALVGITVGGLILGPFVQKHAFGEFWTGFPFGYDLTDNKTLIMWVTWLVACLFLGRRARGREGVRRLGLVAATVVMMGVYLIPHSLRGSELDYSKIDEGAPASEAVETGRR